MPENLYEQPMAGPFTALCGGGTDNSGDAEDCVKIAPLAGGGYALGDAKPAGADRELRFTRDELLAFAEQIPELLAEVWRG